MAQLVKIEFLRDGQHRVWIRAHAGAGRDAEESGFGIDGIKPSVRTELHPGDVVADRFDFPAGHRRNQHREIRFAAGRGKRAGDVLHFALRIGQFQNEHVLGEPAFIARLHGRDAQSVTFLSEQRISAVSGAKGPDFTGFREVADVFVLGVAGPARCPARSGQAERLRNAGP